MAKTSINVQPINGGSEIHNTRGKDLDYVRPELTHLNESWSIDSVQNRLESIKENYQKTTGQTMQKKATPIREGVVVIGKNTTMAQLQDFAKKAEEKFGIKAIQIHTHKDEGHQGAKEWKPNLHAHIVFDWTQADGKSCKLNKQDMAELQTLLSLSLKMDRGQSSDVKHLSAVQYKNNREKEKLEKLEREIKSLSFKKSIKGVGTKSIDAVGKAGEAISKGLEKTKDFFGATTNDKEKNRLEGENQALKGELQEIKQELSQKSVDLVQEKSRSQYNTQRASQSMSEVRELKADFKEVGNELKDFAKHFTPEQVKSIKESYPLIGEAMEKGQQQKQERSQSRGMGR